MEGPKLKWCKEAIEQIRFKPDRDKVQEELLAHIEDRMEAMTARGYSEEEAEARAVAAMGDPAEVGRQLNAVHKPWLGRLWVVSKVLVILMLLMFIRGVFVWNSDYGYDFAPNEHTAGILQEEGAALPKDGARLFYAEPGISARLEDFTVTVEKVTLWRDEMDMERVYGLVTADGFLPWEQPLVTRNFYAVDDQGNYYVPWYINDSHDVRTQNRRREMHLEACGRTATRWRYILAFYPAVDMEWFELRCDLGDGDFVLRVDMTGGDGA